MKTAFNENDIVRLLADERTCAEAFSELVKAFSEQIYWCIRRMVVSHDDANDVLQNTFLKAWKNLPDFQNKSKFSTWLYRIAINEALDFMRKKKTRPDIVPDNDLSMANRLAADPYFDGDTLQAKLVEAVAKLPDVQRTVFNMRYYENLKYSEISNIVGTSEGALKASYHLAVRKIVKYFTEHD